MLNVPVIRWGKPYESLEKAEVIHFETGEPIASVSQANGGIIQRDARKAQKARDILREFSCEDLIAKCKKAAELYTTATLPIGDGTQSPDEFVHAQSASTGLPEAMCRGNMTKNAFVLSEMENVLDALTRGLPLSIFSNGYGLEDRGVIVSYQAQTPVLGAVLPSNSPGVHTLWLPGHPAADRPHAETGFVRAVDSLSCRFGDGRGRRPGRSNGALPRRSRHRTGPDVVGAAQHDFRQCPNRRTVPR